MAEIAYCQRCERIKDVIEDCEFLSCNPALYQREMPADELYAVVREMRERLAAAEQRATDAEATLATIGGADKATLARKLRRANAATRDAEQERAAVIDAFNAMQIANKQTHELWLTRTALLVETLRSLARVSMSDQEYITCPSCGMFLWRHGADCPVRAIMELPAFSPRAALTAPATQPDERAAAERAEVLDAAREVVREGDHAWREHAHDIRALGSHTQYYVLPAISRLRRMLDALDATDGAAKEEA